MAPATQAPAIGKVRDLLCRTAGFHVARMVGKAHDGICVADVHPFRILSRRKECDSKGLFQPAGKNLCLGCLAGFAYTAKYFDFTLMAFRQKDVPIWCSTNFTGIIE